MTVFKYKLCLILLALAPEKIRSIGKFECGEHGRFEYCIDEIPGCVVGCYCYPGFYFDTNSKICEPNSNLLFRRRFVNPDKKRKKKYKKSSAEQRATQHFDELASEASDLAGWLHKTFFSEVEKQAEKQSKTKHTKKRGQIKNRKKKYSLVPKVGKFKKSNRYFRASSAKADPVVHSAVEDSEIATNSDKEIYSDDDYDEYDSAQETDLDEETGSDEENESRENDSGSNTEDSDHGDHDHEHVLLVQNSRPKPTASPLLPSFIFLPNLDSPFYPPLGLPVPPVVPMYPAVPVPPVAPNFPIAGIPPNIVDAKDICSQCHAFIVKTTVKTMTESNKRKKKKRKHTIRPATTLEPATETSIKSTNKTIFESTTDTTIKSTAKTRLSIIETTEKSTANTTSESTSEITKSTTETTVRSIAKTTIQPTKQNNTIQTLTTLEPTTTETELNSTTDKILQSTAQTALNISTEKMLTTNIMSSPSSISTYSTVNDSYAHDAPRRAQDINDYYDFLEDPNSSKLIDRRKELKNQRMKLIRMNDRLLKNEDFRDKTLRWTHNNSKNELLTENDFNVPLRASNLLQAILNHKINDKKLSVTKNHDFKYISDLIHRPEFNDDVKYFDSHPENNLKESKINHAQSHDLMDDSPIKDLQNAYYSNLGRQIASLIRNSKTEQGRVENEDRVIHLKENVPSYFSERNARSRITPFNNTDYLRKSNELLFNLENRVIKTTPGLLRLKKIGNTVSVIMGNRHNVAEKVPENNVTPNIGDTIVNNGNVYWPQEDKNNIVNIKPLEHIVNQNKIGDRGDSINNVLSWEGSNEKIKELGNSVVPYKLHLSKQVQSTNDPKKLPKQFLHHQQSIPKGTKNGFNFNQNPLGMDFFMRTTKRPERSYIGRTFFSGDIM